MFSSKNSIYAILIVFLSYFNLYSQVTTTQDTTKPKYYSESYYNPFYINYEVSNYNNKAGISASGLSFSGITYQYSISNDWRLAGTAFLYLSENSDNKEKSLEYSFGMQVQRIIIRDSRWHIYLLFGGGIFKDDFERNIISSKYVNGVYTTTNEDKKDIGTNITAGIGIGTSYQVSKYLAVDIELGYKYDGETTTIKNLTDLTQFDEIKTNKSVSPFVGIGAYICF